MNAPLRIKIFQYLLSLLFFATPLVIQAAAEEEPQLLNCYDIEDAITRLHCYDEAAQQHRLREVVEKDAEQGPSELDDRLAWETEISGNRFLIIPHNPNYLLLYSYNDTPNSMPSSPTREPTAVVENIQRNEVKFQISFKVQLLRNAVPEPSTLWFGYTQQAFWQLYNQDLSAPFRDSVYEPEIFFIYPFELNLFNYLFNYSSKHLVFGISHQSNGKSEPLSRSWNRLYTALRFNQDNLSLSIKPWWRIPEEEDDDDNSDIHNYMGYAELAATYKNGGGVWYMKLFNNLKTDDNRSTIQLSYSFPLPGRLKGYIEYYNGYGESLLDYNHRNHRIGFGMLLTDWF